MTSKQNERQRVSAHIDRRLRALSEWPTGDRSRAGGASRIAEDIARGYAHLGQEKQAREYYELAAGYCAAALEQAPLENLTPDRAGHHFFTCARILWQAGQKRGSRELFGQALEHYQSGFHHEICDVSITSYHYAIYCWIFLGAFEEARNGAETCSRLQAKSEVPYSSSDVGLLSSVAGLLREGSRSSIERALAEVRHFTKKRRIHAYGAQPHPIVDVEAYVEGLFEERISD
ncbi:MAG: hypothetical protein WBZ24_07080 [Anaerolineales bacterium]|jgi:tetratricopeptide (TPR) repeat protein